MTTMAFGTRRGVFVDVATLPAPERKPLLADQLGAFEALDLLYRSLCAILYNYVPTSGHPAARSPRAASWPASCSTPWTTTSRGPTARTPTSSPTPPATRRWASTRCGRCATRSRGWRRPELLPDDVQLAPAARGPAGLPPQPGDRARRSSRSIGAKALDGHPDAGDARSCGSRPGASGVGVASSIGLALGGRATTTARTRRASTSWRARAG